MFYVLQKYQVQKQNYAQGLARNGKACVSTQTTVTTCAGKRRKQCMVLATGSGFHLNVSATSIVIEIKAIAPTLYYPLVDFSIQS